MKASSVICAAVLLGAQIPLAAQDATLRPVGPIEERLVPNGRIPMSGQWVFSPFVGDTARTVEIGSLRVRVPAEDGRPGRLCAIIASIGGEYWGTAEYQVPPGNDSIFILEYPTGDPTFFTGLRPMDVGVQLASGEACMVQMDGNATLFPYTWGSRWNGPPLLAMNSGGYRDVELRALDDAGAREVCLKRDERAVRAFDLVCDLSAHTPIDRVVNVLRTHFLEEEVLRVGIWVPNLN